MPGQYALVRTGHGRPKWSHTDEGLHIYYTYLGRDATCG